MDINRINAYNIYNTNFTSEWKVKGEKMSSPINELIDELKKRAEFEITDTGYFKDIDVKVPYNKSLDRLSKLGAVVMNKDDEGNKDTRMLKFYAVSGNGQFKRTSAAITIGSRNDILNKINSEDFPKIIDDFIYDTYAYFRDRDIE